MELKTTKTPHSCSIDKVVEHLSANKNTGLSSEEAARRLRSFGPNLLEKKKKKSVLIVFIEQFLDPIIYILSIAMLLAFAFGDWLEGFAVLFVIVMTTLIGFFMELQAIRSVEALQKLAPTMSRVVRDSKVKNIESSLLVPGDVIVLGMGDVVPADARLIETNALALKEASLTGESHQVEKLTGSLDKNTPISDQKNMVFSSTIVSRGNARAVVTSTGNHTKIGEISSLTRKAEKLRTPLEKKLSRLSRKLIWLTLILAAFTTLSGYLQGKDLMLMIKTGIALAVAAIPEGLPIVATISLARGMLRLSRENVIIKKLESVETLGEIGIICTDKTGTLTENKMVVRSIIVQNEKLEEIKLNKHGFSVSNELQRRIFEVSTLCNNAGIGEKNSEDPLETGLLDFVKEFDGDPQSIRKALPRTKEFPFDTDKKRMLTINEEEDHFLVCVKGAMETVLEDCSYLQNGEVISPMDTKPDWLEKGENMASNGLRVLALAYKHINDSSTEPMKDLILLGLVGFEDPPRKDVQQAIETYRSAGVKVVMVTGDHPQTALKIGEEISLTTKGRDSEPVIYGPDIGDLKNISGVEKKKVLDASIFARMVPEQKLDLVSFYQNNNLVVGMLGDGVNDTPALKKADIGIAMGIRGTEAAKEVADVILMDDKFTSTELAIRQGRNIFGNIRHFVVFLLSCNLAEIIAVAIASMSNLPLPLMPLQILFLNLVTDVFPALALGMGRGNKSVMDQPPRPSDEPIITKKIWYAMIAYSLCITLAVIGITWYGYSFNGYSPVIVNNMAFYTLILGQLLNVFNLTSRKSSFIFNEVTSNKWVWGAIIISLLIVVLAYWIPFLNTILSLVPLKLEQLIMVIFFGVISVGLTQFLKRNGLIV
ncbi:cation-transporting P-type ATPase [Gramella jeungdoensis]|uniref:Cation-transporting P-type ATPase n=1 Tax=Gramella jeungdoensis TaxID=708091 RepID=A0ABT0Z2Q8_9FLAO|nr:cation-transporting P-type ATPase [Gramella jeungdoensis]MCM8570017.1 cation-transporting P-type ATPase [Gramella jeungdoensis]